MSRPGRGPAERGRLTTERGGGGAAHHAPVTGERPPMPPINDIGEATREAAWWRLARLLFERPRHEWRAEIAALSRELDDRDLRAMARKAARCGEGAYLRVFGPGGEVPPREITYRRLGDPGHMMAALSEHYRAFSYHPQAEDPIDHIAVEIGFAGYLRLKEAYALAVGDDDALAITRRALDGFLRDHLGPFAFGLAARLQASSAPHLAGVARRVTRRLESLGVRPAPPPHPAAAGALGGASAELTGADDEAPLNCGDGLPCGTAPRA